ncbi:hypothetical protein GCM10023063_11420 [Arthrobacter methylotrophus]|uniref:Membrane protein ArfC n=1 Tax=Arthrobacter methylotrophus TaxID=121291 RepID=A0ABV5UQX2_9MICC
MDWLIWVIVIVLIVAVVWWLLSRNSAKSSSSGVAGSAPSQAASSPTAGQDLAEERTAAPEPETVPASESKLATEPASEPGDSEPGDVDDWERPVPPHASGMDTPPESPAAGSVPGEPIFDEPTLAEPVLSEEEAPEQGAPEPEPEGGVTADDVTPADAGPSGPAAPASHLAPGTGSETPQPATPGQLADSAEWEVTWSEGGAQGGAGAPSHHHEYTDPHAPTLPGAESAAAETVDAAPESTDAVLLGGHLAAEQPYGEGSAAAAADGSGPDGYAVKGNADTMTYHDEDSPSYDEVKAEVWFVSSAHAEAAGFRPPRRNRR